MRFEEAIKFGKATLDGSGYVLFDEDGVLIDNNGVKQYYDKEYLTGTDWEIFEEPKKTLWNKQDEANRMNGLELVFKYDDVKQALKEFMLDIGVCRDLNFLRHKAKEIFGEELLK